MGKHNMIVVYVCCLPTFTRVNALEGQITLAKLADDACKTVIWLNKPGMNRVNISTHCQQLFKITTKLPIEFQKQEELHIIKGN